MPAVLGVAGDRIVAVGDIHGSLDGLVRILHEAGLIDTGNRWAGGDATLVQTGDMLDRGVQLREVMDLLMRLQQEAPTDGGRVIVLLGNHETMNLAGIVRDVNRDVYASFAAQNARQRQRSAYAKYKAFWRHRGAQLGVEVSFSAELKSQWMEAHPEGFFEYVDAFGPRAKFGSWLRDLPLAAVVGDNLFVHGGYGPAVQGVSLQELNARLIEDITFFDQSRDWMVSERLALPWYSVHQLIAEAQRELQDIQDRSSSGETIIEARLQRVERLEAVATWGAWFMLNPESPAWFRGAATWDQSDRGPEMAALLDDLGVRRMVAGHTPQDSFRIQTRFQDRVFLIDTGMLSEAYGGQPSALEIVGDRVTAVYLGERQLLVDGMAIEAAEAAAFPAAVNE
jgi:hypothetical protein